MIKFKQLSALLFERLLSESTKAKGERIIVIIAIVSFLLHLLLIFLVELGWVQVTGYSDLLKNPISAIYTPFSFILVYEVYLLVYYLPKSTTIYVGKQYEIITLIVIRRIFKDLSKLEFTENWFSVQNDLQFTYDLLATLALFFMILLFYRLSPAKEYGKNEPFSMSPRLVSFVGVKKILALLLIPVFFILAIQSFSHWIYESFFSISNLVDGIKDVNKIFFDDFFTVLILVDVLLLLASFLYTDKFNSVIRNSGFIISTILIKLSFGIEGLLNTLLIVVAVLFGLAILAIHNQYDKLQGETRA